MNNTSSNETLSFDTVYVPFIGLLYLSIIIVSILGNAAMCRAIVKIPHLHTATNVFIFNIGLYDICFSTFIFPFELLRLTAGREMIGCFPFSYIGSSLSMVSAYFCIIVAVNRCCTVCMSVNISSRLFSIKKSIVYSMLLWLVGFGQNVTMFFSTSSYYVYNELQRSCETKQVIFKPPSIVANLSGLFGTCLTVSFFYIVIIFTVKRYKNKLVSQLGSSQLSDALRITKLTFLLFICFIALLIPGSVLNSMDPYKQLHPVCYHFMRCLSMVDTVLNVVLYAWMNPQFRKTVFPRLYQTNNTINTSNPVRSSQMLQLRWARQTNSSCNQHT